MRSGSGVQQCTWILTSSQHASRPICSWKRSRHQIGVRTSAYAVRSGLPPTQEEPPDGGILDTRYGVGLWHLTGSVSLKKCRWVVVWYGTDLFHRQSRLVKVSSIAWLRILSLVYEARLQPTSLDNRRRKVFAGRALPPFVRTVGVIIRRKVQIVALNGKSLLTAT